MHHHEAERGLVGQKRLAYGQQVLPNLLLQLDAGANASMDEQVAALAMPQREVAHKRHVRGR